MSDEVPPAAEELRRFISRLPRGGQSALAEALGLSTQHISKFKAGGLVPMLVKAVEIEAMTLGAVEVEAWLTPEQQRRVAHLRAEAETALAGDGREVLRRRLKRSLRDLRRAIEAMGAADPDVSNRLRTGLKQLETNIESLD